VSNEHNERFVTLSFDILHRATYHGLGGYFESVLYPGVELSTHPNTMEAKSSSMISWFPIFFPLKVRGQLYFHP
jgi:protein arginine N-methyltransferase 5